MANGIDLGVIAEGGETDHQLEFLKGKACDEVIPDFISYPLDKDRVESYLKAIAS